MPEEVLERHYITAYQDNLKLDSQQETSELGGTVDSDYNFGSGENWTSDREGSVDYQEVTEKDGNTPDRDGPERRRRGNWFKTFDLSYRLKNKIDDARSLADPSSTHVQNGRAALGRFHDAGIRAAIAGPCYEADKDQFLTKKVTLPAANVIAVDSHKYMGGAGDVGLTVDKIMQAKVFFDERKILKTDRFMSAPSHFYAQLLADDKLSSADYNTVHALVAGEVKFWHGFRHIPHEDWDSANTTQEVYAWQKMGTEYKSRVLMSPEPGIRPDKRHNWYVYGELERSGARIEDNTVLKILAKH